MNSTPCICKSDQCCARMKRCVKCHMITHDFISCETSGCKMVLCNVCAYSDTCYHLYEYEFRTLCRVCFREVKRIK